MDFSLYKNRLLEYLRIKGVDIDTGGNFSCINPKHGDSTPSCNVYEEKGAIKFHCFGCGCGGDIYDAVELLDGIADRAGQFKFLESVFGGNYMPPPMKKIYVAKKQKYQHVPAKYDELEKYMAENPMREKMVRKFLETRARIASHGTFSAYSDDVSDNLVKLFLYYPGNDIARQDVGAALLAACHVPQKASEKAAGNGYTWNNSGVALRLGAGFKLYFYKDNTCVKPGTLGCSTFPMPNDLPADAQSVVLVEGELDAACCIAAGIPHVYAIGGTNGLTAPKVQQYLLGVKEIILMLDNDVAGVKTMGVIPLESSDKRRTPLPDIIRRAGYTGSIKIARLNTYKDPDDCILHRRKDIVIDAIKNAVEYVPLEQSAPEKKAAKKADGKTTGGEENTTGTLGLKDVQAILKRLPVTDIEKKDIAPFVSAVMHAVPGDIIRDVTDALRVWGAAEPLLKKPGKTAGSYLITIGEKYNFSYYFLHKIELATIKQSDLEKIEGGFDAPAVDIDFDEMIKDKHFLKLVYRGDEKFAANVVTRLLTNRVIFVDSEKKGAFYFYNGHVWKHTADIHGIVHNILLAITEYAIKKLSDDEADNAKLKPYKTLLFKIGKYSFLSNVVRLLRGMPAIYRKEVSFDGAQIQETLTLEDGVIDFSGKKVVFRAAKPDEYRRVMLPYTTDQVREKKTPEKFLQFLDSYFTDKETLKTLIYFLSLIGSRRAQFKVGGIFVGATGTGKTTLMKFIGEVYRDMIVVLPPSLIMDDGRKFHNDDSPSPFMARLEGAGCAVRDETPRNGRLRAEKWKELTGGGKLTARGMWAEPRDFVPTAQTIIMSNYPPRFDGNDQATIDRMVAINFCVQHKKDGQGGKTEDDLRKELLPEYPLVIKYFAERYIELKNEHNSIIPLSDECKAFRAAYVEDQKTDLGKFFDLYVDVNIAGGADCKIRTHDLFRRFCQYVGIELDENDKPTDSSKWSLTSFTKAILSDYVGVHVKQIKENGYPVQFYTGLKLKDGVEQKTPAQPQQQSLIPTEPQRQPYADDTYTDDMPGDDPFGNDDYDN